MQGLRLQLPGSQAASWAAGSGMAVEFDAEVLSRAERIPAEFVWPAEERPAGGGAPVLVAP